MVTTERSTALAKMSSTTARPGTRLRATSVKAIAEAMAESSMVLVSCPVRSMAPHWQFFPGHIISSDSHRRCPPHVLGVWSAFTFDSEGTAGGLSDSPPFGGNDFVSSSALSPKGRLSALSVAAFSFGINAALFVPRAHKTADRVRPSYARTSPAFSRARILARQRWVGSSSKGEQQWLD